MARKIIFGSIWLALVIYTIFFAPAAAGKETLDLIIDLSIIKWEGINPIIIAIFYIMGVFPWVYAAFILFDSAGQKISAYPFFIASIGFGAFALLPYLALRQSNTTWNGEKNLLLKILDSRLMAIISSITIMVFIVWGLIKGNWLDFFAQWQTSQFIHTMSLDFCLLCILFPTILQDDMERRGIKEEKFFWLAALVPLLGTLVYWCVRPQLPEVAIDSSNSFIEGDDAV
ncbi:MAG: DUF2834 domain-containing protein [Pleurocapsa sp. MO_192.B19]|nr:DUF2834 domain-containing protein [Pleurocapsa sp. MO_192.B19]